MRDRKRQFYSAQNSRGGFTVIEMILGLFLFSLIATGVYSTFGGGLKLIRWAGQSRQTDCELSWIGAQMTKDLENAVYYDFSGSYPQLRALEGRPDTINFILAMPDGLKAVSYYLEKSDDAMIRVSSSGPRSAGATAESLSKKTRLLIREERPFVDFLNPQNRSLPEKEILSSSITESGLRFRYAANNRQSDMDTILWRESWTDPVLPTFVRVELTMPHPRHSERAVVYSRDIFIPMGGG